jgi:hypothetical protein
VTTFLQFVAAAVAGFASTAAIYLAGVRFGKGAGDVMGWLLVGTAAGTAVFVWLLTTWVFA